MNKLIFLGLFALVAVACANEAETQANEEVLIFDEETQMALMPDDDTEIKFLQNSYYRDFCTQSRDEVKSFIQNEINSALASVFEALFSAGGEVGADILSANKEAIAKGAEIIQHNAVPIEEDGPLPAGEIKKNLDANIKQLTLFQSATAAVKVVISTIVDTARQAFFERLAMLRTIASSAVLKDRIMSACDSVSNDLSRRLETQFNDSKKSIRVSLSKNPEKKDDLVKVMSAKYENVGCLTAGRIAKVSKFCDVVKLVGPSLMTMLNIV